MIGKLLRKWQICLCAALIGFSGSAHSNFHAWQITEVYSNANGTVQFIEFTALAGSQQFLQNHTLNAAGNFTFPSNLPGDTAGRKFLVGTNAFAALSIVAPDYIVANNFLGLTNGTINFGESADIFSYASLPTDGVLSLNRNLTTGTNSPTNFAGATGTIPPPVTVPGAPAIGTATAGNGQATVTFTAPGNNGGAAITGYTATCGTQSADNTVSPITVAGLANGQTVTCSVVATNSQGNSLPSANSNSVTPATLPDAPVIGIAIPGNLEAFISFTPPAGNGGSVITSYTATCNPGMLSATGTTSPITVGSLMNNQLYSCSVTAANAIGTGAASATVDVTPDASPPLSLVAVYSRKTHTGFSPFNLKIETGVAIGGNVSVEPRSSTSHTIVFVFNKPVTSVASAAVTPLGTASQSPPSDKEIAVILTGVPDRQRLTVSLTDVNGVGVNVEASMGFLVGDVSSARSVNAGDISSLKARQNQTLDTTNFKFDLTTSGAIDQADVSVVKSRSGVVLP